MAENITEREDSDGCEVITEETQDRMVPTTIRDILECAVCLQPCVHPVQLLCGHIFCYLCVKGIANQSKRCAMCRQEIPTDFLDHPQLVRKEDLDHSVPLEDGQQWFYEGRNGWWQYDERTSLELESAYKRSDQSTELLIAGFLYIIDFEGMLQMRRNDPSRKRRIKRDLASIPKKGVAGLRVESNAELVSGSDDHDREIADGEERIVGVSGAAVLASHVARSLDMSSLASERTKSPSPTQLIPPNNTPQTPHTPSANSERSSPDVSEYSLNRAMAEIEGLRISGESLDSSLRDVDRGVTGSRE